MRGDRGDVILGWLTKVALVLGLLGVIGFDAVSVGVTNMNAADMASSAAGLAAEEWNASKNVNRAYRAASSYVEEHGGTLATKDFRIEPDGTVRLRMEKDATTILLYRTKTTKKWTHVVAEGSRRRAA